MRAMSVCHTTSALAKQQHMRHPQPGSLPHVCCSHCARPPVATVGAFSSSAAAPHMLHAITPGLSNAKVLEGSDTERLHNM
jgi:hypothetical protein